MKRNKIKIVYWDSYGELSAEDVVNRALEEIDRTENADIDDVQMVIRSPGDGVSVVYFKIWYHIWEDEY